MALRRWNERGEAGDESERFELEGGCAIRPRFLEVQSHVAVVDDLEPVVNDPPFCGLSPALRAISEIAWESYRRFPSLPLFG
jgi:hypothetical protein